MKYRRLLINLHHTIGAYVAVWLLFMALSGIVLNHPAWFKLDNIALSYPFFRNLYHLNLDQNIPAFKSQGNWLSQIDRKLFLNGRAIDIDASKLSGLVSLPSATLIIADGSVLSLSPQGDVLRAYFPDEDFTGEAIKIGQYQNQIYIQTQAGNFIFQAQQWQAVTSLSKVHWSQEVNLNPAQLEQLNREFFAQTLHLQRIISDLHNGSFWGPATKIINDFAALALIFLAISGFSLHQIRKSKEKNKT